MLNSGYGSRIESLMSRVNNLDWNATPKSIVMRGKHTLTIVLCSKIPHILAFCSRGILARISLHSTCQRYGFGCSLWAAMYAVMTRDNSKAPPKLPVRTYFCVMSAKEHSTSFIQEIEIGVRCMWNRGDVPAKLGSSPACGWSNCQQPNGFPNPWASNGPVA